MIKIYQKMNKSQEKGKSQLTKDVEYLKAKKKVFPDPFQISQI